jgi:hypothetical protein
MRCSSWSELVGVVVVAGTTDKKVCRVGPLDDTASFETSFLGLGEVEPGLDPESPGESSMPSSSWTEVQQLVGEGGLVGRLLDSSPTVA